MNLTEELDRSFDIGPEHRPIEERLVAGRRLVRRRRVAASAAALAIAAVLGTVGFALGDGNGTSADSSMATQQPDDPEYMPGQHVRLDRDRGLLTRPGVQVVREVDNPEGLTPPENSLGLVYTFEGKTYWGLLETYGSATPAAYGSATREAYEAFPTFDYWLADVVAMRKGEETLALVRFGEGETLLPREGVEIIRQTGDLSMMRRSFAGPNALTAVAEVTYRGERWYVLSRKIGDGPPEYFPVAASVSRPTLAEFLDYSVDAFDSFR